MPIGEFAPQQLVSGLAPTPAVTAPGNVITPDAVTALVDAFHKGVITSNDMIDHIGVVAQAKKRTALQEMQEYVSPDAISARQSQRQAITAQNELAAQTAEAQSGLVQPTSSLAAQKLAQEQAQVQMGPTGLAFMQQNGWMFGKTMDDFRKPDGSTDFVEATKEGNRGAGQLALANAWLERMQPVKTQEVTDAAGGVHTHQLNSRGEDVTPPMPNQGYEGSPLYWGIVKQLQDYLPDYHPMRSRLMLTKPNLGANANTMRPGPIVDGQPTNLVGPASPQAQPAPQVSAPEPTFPTGSGEGVLTKSAPGSYQVPAEIRKDMVADPIVKTMLDQQKYVTNFKTIADNQESMGATIPGKDVPAQNANDIGLAESIVKLYDPQAAIREFKWEKLEESQPWLEKIGAWKQLALHKGSFTPESRARLIKMGDEIINGTEAAARGRLALAQNAAKSSQAKANDPADWVGLTLTPEELRVLRNEPFRTPKTFSPATTAGSAPAANSGVVILKTGPYAGWKYDPRTGTVSQ